MADKLIAPAIEAGIGAMTGASNLGRNNPNEELKQIESHDQRPHQKKWFWQQAKENWDIYWEDQKYEEEEQKSQPPIEVNLASSRPVEEEVKYGQQERIVPRRPIQRYRPDSDSWMMQTLFGAESINRNQNTIEQFEHDQANQRIEQELLDAASEPLEEDQLQSRIDAENLANQMVSAINAEELADQIIAGIEEGDWDDDEQLTEEELEQMRITWKDWAEFAIKLPLPIVIILAFLIKGKKKQMESNIPVPPQQTEVPEQEVGEEDVGGGCRKYSWVDSQGRTQSMIICQNGDMTLPQNPAAAIADYPIDQFDKLMDLPYMDYLPEEDEEDEVLLQS